MKNALLAAVFSLSLVSPAASEVKFQTVTLTPETIEEKIGMSDVVLVGTALTVETKTDEKPPGGRDIIEKVIAEVAVESVIKGFLGEKTVSVEFERSDLPQRPPLTVLQAGERALLFLKRDPGSGVCRFITPYAGKASADDAVPDEARKAVERAGENVSLGVEMRLAKTEFARGEAINFEIIISNRGGVPVTLNTRVAPSRDILLVGPGGEKIAPLTPSSELPQPPREDFSTLPPRHFAGFAADLLSYFSVGQPGDYSVAAVIRPASGAHLNLPAWTGALSSKAVAFKVR